VIEIYEYVKKSRTGKIRRSKIRKKKISKEQKSGKKMEKMKLGKENCVKEIKHLDVFFSVSCDRDQQNSY